MACATVESPIADWVQLPERTACVSVTTRNVAVLLFDNCSLAFTVIIAEIFHAANELALKANRNRTYELSFLSAAGGNVKCTSSICVLTDGLDARHCLGFDAVFVADGIGARVAAGDGRLIAWLRRVQANLISVRAIGEGRHLFDASCAGSDYPYAEFSDGNVRERASGDDHRVTNVRLELIKGALVLIKRDLGEDIARGVAERVMPDAIAGLTSILEADANEGPVDKVQIAARWMKENCQHAISIVDAARVADMSPRNFQRRFKFVVGVTPSAYLLHARFAIVCSLLTHSELPVDKIARHTGMSNGDRLAKMFRRRMKVSPTEYRAKARRDAGI
ncbi:helix-turn-helix domain-containing protein [Paraburkholderia hospita]|uniref:helix-turn-helix domain-containing protein n=1 Tax=Paraburkholderia hospita TaxID=169430 RepID=UPI000B34242B|nr:helix-turn-helix domain-containing protein [Paraburkholderia hospita]OUL94244.1 AraC family transcriptional regulator [Paraburkholderia hospita]